MGKRSKKLAKQKNKKGKAQTFNEMVAMERASKLEKGSIIPTEAAINPAIQERIETEEKRFILLFYDYNIRECELDKLDRTKARALIKKFRDITSFSPRTISSSGIIRRNIVNSGPYRSLYSGLSPDIELKETELPDGGRMFFHTVCEYFCVVAIKVKHIRT